MRTEEKKIKTYNYFEKNDVRSNKDTIKNTTISFQKTTKKRTFLTSKEKQLKRRKLKETKKKATKRKTTFFSKRMSFFVVVLNTGGIEQN